MASLLYRGHSISEMRVSDLKKELAERGLEKTGNKSVLLVRLAKALADEGVFELKEGDINALETMGSPKGAKLARLGRREQKDAGVVVTEQDTSASRSASRGEQRRSRSRDKLEELNVELIDSVDQQEEDGSPEVIIVEETVDEGEARSSGSDMMPETIVIEGQMETDKIKQRKQLEESTDANVLATSGTRHEADGRIDDQEIAEDQTQTDGITSMGDVTVMDDVMATDDLSPGNLIISDDVDDELVAMAAGNNEYQGTECDEGNVGYQAKPVEESSGQQAAVEETLISTQIEDETPPGTPEEGPEPEDSLVLFQAANLTGKSTDRSIAQRASGSKVCSSITSSALEEEVSEMEQLDFEEDHLLIFPESDEKEALDAYSEEERAGDEKSKPGDDKLKAESRGKKTAVADESIGRSQSKQSLAKAAVVRSQPAKKLAATHMAKKTGVDLAAKSGCSLWVRNIATTTRANDLKSHFSQYGAVMSAKIVAHPKSRDKHYGIITMQSAEDATKCIQSLHRTELHGRLILVEKGKLDTSKIVSGATKQPAKQQASSNVKQGSNSQSSKNTKSRPKQSPNTRKPDPQKRPSARTALSGSRSSRYTKPSPVHPPQSKSPRRPHLSSDSKSSHSQSNKDSSRKDRTSESTRSSSRSTSRSQLSSSKSDRIVQLSDALEEKRPPRLSTRHGRDVDRERDRTERRRSSLDIERERIREPDLRERLGPPVRPPPVSIRDRLGPRVEYERRPLFDPEEDERIRLDRERQFIEERARQREAREVERREFERMREREKQREIQRELERREVERQREFERQRELQRQRDLERQRELERERLREREKLKQLERERERERERIRELERQRRHQEEERERLQRERELRELAAEKEQLRVKQESVRRAADKARRERERIEREQEEMEIALQRERSREWEMRRKRGPSEDVGMGFQPERKRVTRNEWSRAEQRDQRVREMRHVEDISPPHRPPGGYYESSHPSRMKGSPPSRQRWQQNRDAQGNLLEQIAQNQRELLDKIASREAMDDDPSMQFSGSASPEGPMYGMGMQSELSGTTGGLDPVTLNRLASAAHGMHADQAALAALAVLQRSRSGRAERGDKKRPAPPMERKPEKKGDGVKPGGKKDFGGPPPRPAQRGAASQRGRGPPPPATRGPGNQKSASELAAFAQQMLKNEPSPFMGGSPFPHPGMMRPHHPLAMPRMAVPPFGVRPYIRPGMHPMARLPGHDRFNPGYQPH